MLEHREKQFQREFLLICFDVYDTTELHQVMQLLDLVQLKFYQSTEKSIL